MLATAYTLSSALAFLLFFLLLAKGHSPGTMSLSTGIIVAMAGGGAFLVALVAAVCILVRRRRKTKVDPTAQARPVSEGVSE